MAVPDYEFSDALGNRLTVETLTSAVAVVTITQDDKDPAQVAQVLIGPDDMQLVADAVRESVQARDRRPPLSESSSS